MNRSTLRMRQAAGLLLFTMATGCSEPSEPTIHSWTGTPSAVQWTSGEVDRLPSEGPTVECSGSILSAESAEAMIPLTEPGPNENEYSTLQRLEDIAAMFEACNDPWGLFPTVYKHITQRVIDAMVDGDIEDTEWARDLIVDFGGRYFSNLNAALTGKAPSYAWSHYYYLADHPGVSPTRALLVAMVTHLTLDLPYTLVEVGSTEEHKEDYFMLGDLMIEVTGDFLVDLKEHYDTDPTDILNGFFLGKWIDELYGPETAMTLSFQTIRTKAWNNRWLLEHWWGEDTAAAEIYTAFWTIDGVLASLDAAGTI